MIDPAARWTTVDVATHLSQAPDFTRVLAVVGAVACARCGARDGFDHAERCIRCGDLSPY